MKTLKDVGEKALLEHYRNRFPLSKDVYLGSGDDTAVLYRDKNTFDLLTTDFVIEGRHFQRSKHTGFEIGWKAMVRNLSDIAAMGGEAVAAVVGLACPGTTPTAMLADIERGLLGASKRFSCPIVGGDLSTAPKITLCVTVLGRVRKKCLTTRAGARIGDLIMCTGTLGGSIYGKHVKFMPRLKEARFLTMHAKPRAMIDVSDGLAQDLGHMLDASKCGAMLYEVQLPISSELKKHYTKHSTQIQHVLGDGEDYELLFTMSRAKAERLYAYIEKHKVKTRFTVIGKIIREKGIRLERVDGSVQRVLVRGYEHFK